LAKFVNKPVLVLFDVFQDGVHNGCKSQGPRRFNFSIGGGFPRAGEQLLLR
jgi:hypothetical protein